MPLARGSVSAQVCKHKPNLRIFSNGFTLVELLVVISLIAILVAVGMTFYGRAQMLSRDSERRLEVGAIAKALEANKPFNTVFYAPLVVTQFSPNAIPTDVGTVGNSYCISVNTASAVPPGVPTTWAANAACPSAPAGYNAVTTTSIAANSVMAWTVCARLEVSTGSTGAALQIYCQSSSQ